MDILNRKQEPAFRDIEKIKLIQPEVDKLSNGIDLYYIDASDADLVRIEFIFDNPSWLADQPLAISSTNHLLNEGTTHYTAVQLAEKIDFYGAFYQHEAGFDQSTVTLYSLNKHLKSTLPIIKEIITEAVFPEDELSTYKQNSKQKLQVNQQKNDFLARVKFNEILFSSKSGYGYAAQLADYDNLKRESLLNFHKKQYHAGNCTIIIAGKVTQEERQLIAEIFGNSDWLHEVDQELNGVVNQSSSQSKHFVERPDAIQSAIRIGKPLFNKTHPDFHSLQVLNTVLGGYFGSRLMSNIREDKGYTYGIGSRVASLKNSGYFFITTEVGADVCGNAVAEIYKEIDRLKNEPVPTEELDLVRNYLLGTFQGSLENAFSYADKFKGLLPYGLGYDYYDNYFDTVRSISPQRLQELANQYFTNGLFEVVVGKR
ncbi:M16 family metallopeptidase [Solitalea koreensis]|uniref:Predicted Zn-dependent peptidase n=1 Tax=Solitalea koreensis TaxID=543615 RepID=A0A521DXU3_9SPHI|nr:pitrilysin family protein [Solitalea koreensis]SMO76455.1 Predicted Zn-dependent peptidase [Solitalea koreensis]